MDMKNAKKEGKTVWKGDHFDRLSEDLLILILSQILDLKSLCQCLLVCKRFAQAVLCIEKVSIVVPADRCSAFAEAEEATYRSARQGNFTPVNAAQLKEKLIGYIRLSLPPRELPRCLTSLQKFRKLKSINVSLTISNKSSRQQNLKWKVKLRTSGTLWIARMVSLNFTSIRKITDANFDGNRAVIRTAMCLLPVLFCKDLMELLWRLQNNMEALKTVVATTCDSHCKLVLGDDLLTEIRKVNTLGPNPLSFKGGKLTRAVTVPEVTLPKSGYILNGIDLLMMDFLPESATLNESDDPRTWEYDDDEELLGEVVKKLLT